MRLGKRSKKFLLILGLTPMMVLYTNCSGGLSDYVETEQQQASNAPPTGASPTPTVSPAPSATPQPSVTPSPSATPKPSVTPTPTVSPSPTASPMPSVTPTPSPSPSGKVMAMMAAGHQARTVLSCDGGKSWINDRSDNPNARCWVTGDANYVECDHTAVSAQGQIVTYANGYFYTQFGWGVNGSVRRSVDGITWTVLRTGDWAGGIGTATGSNRVFSLWGNWTYSNDNGATWLSSTKSFGEYDMAHPLVFLVGSKLFAVGRVDNPLQLAISSDSGLSWTTVPSFQSAWGGSFAEGSSGVIVSLATTVGQVARSTDGGKTWTTYQAHSKANESWSSPLLYNGTQFVAFSGNKKYVSTDGITWTSTAMVNAPGAGPAAYNPVTKTYSVILNEWDNYYAKQKAWVSTDAVTWTQLSATQFKGGHPLTRIVIGEVDKTVCP
jgi:hypothetical protein